MGSSPTVERKTSAQPTKKEFESMEKRSKESSTYSSFSSHTSHESVITGMLRISHFQTIYNILVAILFISLMGVCFFNYIEKGCLLDLSLFLWNFGHFPLAAVIWLFYFLGTFSVVNIQQMVATGDIETKVAHTIYYGIVAFYGLSGPFLIRNVFQFPPATSAFLIMEIVRFCMKMHSFMKVNQALDVSKSLNVSEEAVTQYPQNVTVSNFFYFLWAPTLVYQPSYPRTPSIRWSFVFARFAEVAMFLTYIYAIFTRSIIPVFQEVTGDWISLTRGIFQLMLPSIATSVLMHLMFLHCWMNAFAELTRFADREFYLDWWNSTDWAQFYRKWNYLVHRFIHRHVYWELRNPWKMGRRMSLIITFFISAVIHEYVIATTIGFYMPILFFMFLFPGVLFIPLSRKLQSRFSNVFMWTMLILGHGILMGLYGRAWMRHYRPEMFQLEVL